MVSVCVWWVGYIYSCTLDNYRNSMWNLFPEGKNYLVLILKQLVSCTYNKWKGALKRQKILLLKCLLLWNKSRQTAVNWIFRLTDEFYFVLNLKSFPETSRIKRQGSKESRFFSQILQFYGKTKRFCCRAQIFERNTKRNIGYRRFVKCM